MTSPSAVQFLAQQPLPFEVKTVVIDPEGQTAQRRSADQIRFWFEFEGHSFQAETARKEQLITLRLISQIGRMPYSIESQRKRTDVAAILSAGRELPYGCFFVDQNQNIWLENSIEIEQPMTSTSLLVATTMILLATRPWLSFLMGVLQQTG